MKTTFLIMEKLFNVNIVDGDVYSHSLQIDMDTADQYIRFLFSSCLLIPTNLTYQRL